MFLEAGGSSLPTTVLLTLTVPDRWLPSAAQQNSLQIT